MSSMNNNNHNQHGHVHPSSSPPLAPSPSPLPLPLPLMTLPQPQSQPDQPAQPDLAPQPDLSVQPQPQQPQHHHPSTPPPNPSFLARARSRLVHPHTQIRYTDPSFARPPPLNYSLRTRKKSIVLFWALVALDCIAMPIALYFGLWYGTGLSHNAVFSISTGAIGTVSVIEYFVRFRRLWRKGSTCRVIGARRWYLDWFHWNLSVAWIAVMIELIVGTVPHEPPIRLLAMPLSSMVFAFGIELLIVDAMRLLSLRSPVRISSVPRGAPLRPGIYSFIEDVCAVDGSGGTEFRQRLNLRYLASKPFRFMLHRLTLFWAAGALAAAAGTTALVFTLQRDAAYVVGWTVPFLWAAVWAVGTTKWVQKSLVVEERMWREESLKRSGC